MYRVGVLVQPRPGVCDPQAEAVGESLDGLGYAGVGVTRVGRHLEMTLDRPDEAAARELADELCARLLVNPNLETYSLTLEKVE